MTDEAASPADEQSSPQTLGRALWLRRVLARMLDAAIVLPAGYLLVQVVEATEGRPISRETETLPATLAALSEAAVGGLLVWFVYEIVAVARWGRTLGKAAAGIRVVPAEPTLIPRWGSWVRRRHLLEEQRLNDRIEQLHGESPRRVFGGLVARVRDDGGSTQRLESAQRRLAAHLDQLQQRHTVRPGGLRALMRTVVLVAVLVLLVTAADVAVGGTEGHWVFSVAVRVLTAILLVAWLPLVARRRGAHDMIAPTAVVRA